MEVGDDYWDVFRTREPYRYKFDTTEYVQENMFKGDSNRIMGEGLEIEAPVQKKRKLHLIHLPDENAISNYKIQALSFNPTDFRPFFTMKSDNTHELQGTVFGVGRHIGVSIKDWLKDPGRVIWEYHLGNYIRLGEDLRLIGRLLGAGVYANHMDGKFIGDLLNSSYFDQTDGKIIFAKDPQNHSLSTMDGIQSDLRELISLVGWVQQEIPRRDNQVMGDILIFNDMFPQTYVLPNTIPELKELSYFLCHNFLYFEDSQRFAFADAFRRMKITIPEFEKRVRFRGQNSIPKNWESVLPPAFKICFDYLVDVHGSACGQIHFHRSCLHHYNTDRVTKKLEKKELDQQLIRILPLAIPKGFSAFFKCVSISQADKIKELKQDIDYLQQYKLET